MRKKGQGKGIIIPRNIKPTFCGVWDLTRVRRRGEQCPTDRAAPQEIPADRKWFVAQAQQEFSRAWKYVSTGQKVFSGALNYLSGSEESLPSGLQGPGIGYGGPSSFRGGLPAYRMALPVPFTAPDFGLGRFQNHIGVLGRIASSDQADCVGNALLELHMRLVDQRNPAERLGKPGPGQLIVVGKKLLRHPRLAHHEISPKCLQNLKNRWEPINEGDINRFNLRPEWKSAIRNDDCIRVPDSA